VVRSVTMLVALVACATTTQVETSTDEAEIPFDASVPATCDAFCGALIERCAGDHVQYADESTCLSYCEGWSNDSPELLACRAPYMAEALVDPARYCPVVGWRGGGLCEPAADPNAPSSDSGDDSDLPTDPTDPAEPTDPTDSTDSDPSDAADPSDALDPSDAPDLSDTANPG
jgi:hypothetical protein